LTIVDDSLHQGLTGALDNPSVYLALDEQRINHSADVVYYNVAVLKLALSRAELIAKNSPVSVEASKKLALLDRTSRYRATETEGRKLAAEVRSSSDHLEGIRAFLEKRAANYCN
jgi:enoyl-CoA hydratase/carnithine racemase